MRELPQAAVLYLAGARARLEAAEEARRKRREALLKYRAPTDDDLRALYPPCDTEAAE